MTDSAHARSVRLILVRHGESEGNRDRVFTHSPEVALTERGRRQARAAGARIQESFRPDVVVSSPYRRARDTAALIADVLRLSLHIDEAFREQSLGELAGQPYDVVRDDPTFDPALRWRWRPPGGESLLDVQRRAAPALDQLVRSHGGRDVVLVSHGGVMFALWAHVARSWEAAQPAGNAGIVVIEYDGRGYREPRFFEQGESGRDVATLSSSG